MATYPGKTPGPAMGYTSTVSWSGNKNLTFTQLSTFTQ